MIRLLGLLSFFLLSPASQAAEETGLGLVINFPHVYHLSYESLSRSDRWSWAAGAGVIPTVNFKSGSSNIGLSMVSGDVRGRWHPFRGAFFLGLALGVQNVSASATQPIVVSGQSIPTLVSVSVSNLFLTPHVGWIWTPGRLMLGVEIGSQSGFGGRSKLGMSITDPDLQGYLTQVQGTTEYQRFENNVEEGFAKFGDMRLTYIAVRLGWMF